MNRQAALDFRAHRSRPGSVPRVGIGAPLRPSCAPAAAHFPLPKFNHTRSTLGENEQLRGIQRVCDDDRGEVLVDHALHADRFAGDVSRHGNAAARRRRSPPCRPSAAIDNSNRSSTPIGSGRRHHAPPPAPRILTHEPPAHPFQLGDLDLRCRKRGRRISSGFWNAGSSASTSTMVRTQQTCGTMPRSRSFPRSTRSIMYPRPP